MIDKELFNEGIKTIESELSDVKDALNYIDDYWQEDAEMWGKQISGEIQVWAHALELGFRWKKPQEAPGQMSLLEGNGK